MQAAKKPLSKRRSKKRTSVRWKIVLAGLLVLLIFSPFYYGYVIREGASAWRWIKDAGHPSSYRNYKSFHIRIPANYKIHGIDVSSYQGKIDWQKVKYMHEDSVRVTFAFIKATEGITVADPYFQRNWREAPKAGIVCGAYHYFRPRLGGKLQARFFLQVVKVKKGMLPMVVDIEELNGVTPAKMRMALSDFLLAVKAKTRAKPIIYTGMKFYQDNLAGHFDDYPLWVAHYNHPRPGKTINWKFWQHSESARVNGVPWVVDFDVFNGDSAAFKNLLVR